MEIVLIIIAALCFTGLVFYIVAYLSNSAKDSSMKNIMSAQRDSGYKDTNKEKRTGTMLDIAANTAVKKKSRGDSGLTVAKKLRYAQWKMTPTVFHVCQAVISIAVFLLVGRYFSPVIQVVMLVTGPLVMGFLVDRAINKRFEAFDQDYAPFLLSLVGLIKTGMNPISAIEAAAGGLEHGSLLRLECELMLERMRFGVPEESSIGSFAEDILHPEVELFVQALLLSKRVGGTLSDTLDRLSRQIRKRQYFRKQAIAAVGMQKGSIWFIIAIMVALMLYLYIIYPASIVYAIKHPTGWLVYQFGGSVVGLGIYWVKQVTKMRV